jgi:hypothetical protein
MNSGCPQPWGKYFLNAKDLWKNYTNWISSSAKWENMCIQVQNWDGHTKPIYRFNWPVDHQFEISSKLFNICKEQNFDNKLDNDSRSFNNVIFLLLKIGNNLFLMSDQYKNDEIILDIGLAITGNIL